MDVEIFNSPASAAAKVALAEGNKAVANAGTMIALLGAASVHTTIPQRGQTVNSGRTHNSALQLNHFVAGPGGCAVFLAGRMPGDLVHLELRSSVGLFVSEHAFLAHSEKIEMGAADTVEDEAGSWLKLAGNGTVLVSSSGAAIEMEIDGEFGMEVSHLIAYEETLSSEISKVDKSIAISQGNDFGIFCLLRGKGKLWYQSHDCGTMFTTSFSRSAS